MEQIYLSKRNLLVLLSKLARNASGDPSACTIVKYANDDDPYCQSMDSVIVTAVPDELYYESRDPGEMHPTDEIRMKNNNVA